MVNGTGEAGQGTLEAGPLPSADWEAEGVMTRQCLLFD